MLTLTGEVRNVFRKHERVDKKTGEVIPATDHVQLLAEQIVPGGEVRLELVTLKIDKPDAYRGLDGRVVRVPVGIFVQGTGYQFYALKGPGVEGPTAA